MKKRIITSILMATLILGSAIPAFAETTDTSSDTVEISFKVGDSVLYINQKPTEVETPYVVGEGTTLVPLRVITEAFGATVTWEDATQKITLDYPDVNIVLQIGNTVAEVNGRAETLSAAPVLSDNGVTMVPLRFISETFGAEVGYDDATAAISVIKTKQNDGNKTVTGTIEHDIIGDSYYGWSMNTSSLLYIDDRSFDGSSTLLMGDGGKISVDIDLLDNDFNFDKYFSDLKSLYSSGTLMKADRGLSTEGYKSIHIQSKTTKSFIDDRSYIKDDKIYTITCYVDIDKIDQYRDTYTGILDTFKLLSTSDMYDLSGIDENGYRTFEDDTYKVSFKVPKDWYKSKSSSATSFTFYKNSNTYDANRIHCEIFSKSGTSTAKSYAEKDLAESKEFLDPEKCKITDVATMPCANKNAYYYTISISNTDKEDALFYDVFIDSGDYIYNVSVNAARDGKDVPQTLIDTVLGSLKINQINSADIGSIIRYDYDTASTFEIKKDDFNITLPVTWHEVTTDDSSVSNFMDARTGAAATITVIRPSNKVTMSDVDELADLLVKNRTEQSGFEKVQGAMQHRINNKLYKTYVIKKTNDKSAVYYVVGYCFYHQSTNKIYTVDFLIPELLYSPAYTQTLDNIIAGMKLQ